MQKNPDNIHILFSGVFVATAGVADFFKGEIKRMRLRTRDIISEANSPVATPTDTAKEVSIILKQFVVYMHWSDTGPGFILKSYKKLQKFILLT